MLIHMQSSKLNVYPLITDFKSVFDIVLFIHHLLYETSLLGCIYNLCNFFRSRIAFYHQIHADAFGAGLIWFTTNLCSFPLTLTINVYIFNIHPQSFGKSSELGH